MKIRDFEIKGCIFDLDGTLLDSCSIWSEVDKNFFKKRNMEVPSDYAKAIMALGLKESAEYTKRTYSLDDSIEDIMNEWLNDVQKKYEHEVKLKNNARKYLKKLNENGIPLVIATANTSECYAPCIDRLGITKYFIGAYDVRNFKDGKKNPEIFVKCAEGMNLKPNEIMVFEDSVVALETAKKAGFITCGVYDSTCGNENEKKNISDIYINDFGELM